MMTCKTQMYQMQKEKKMKKKKKKRNGIFLELDERN